MLCARDAHRQLCDYGRDRCRSAAMAGLSSSSASCAWIIATSNRRLPRQVLWIIETSALLLKHPPIPNLSKNAGPFRPMVRQARHERLLEVSGITEIPCSVSGTVGKGFGWGYNESHADVAQPEEQRFRKPQVKGSSPFIGSTFAPTLRRRRQCWHFPGVTAKRVERRGAKQGPVDSPDVLWHNGWPVYVFRSMQTFGSGTGARVHQEPRR